MAEENNKTTPAVAETAAATEENSQVATTEEKKHDVEYADEEGKNAVSIYDVIPAQIGLRAFFLAYFAEGWLNAPNLARKDQF